MKSFSILQNTITKNGGLLGVFAIVASAVVAGTHLFTKDTIAAQIQAQKVRLLANVIPQDYFDNNILEECLRVDDERLGGQQRIYRGKRRGEVSSFAIETTATNGYSGDIDLLVGIDTKGKVLGVRVLSHKETPGLGDKIELDVSDWILSFDNKVYSESEAPRWKVKKDGGQFDQFTGATITPRAVVGTVAQTVQWLAENQHQLTVQAANCAKINEQ